MIDPGHPAPEVVLDSLEGKKVELPDGPSMLAFYTRECGASRILIPRMTRLLEALLDLNVWVISQDDREETEAFMNEEAPDLHVLLDHDPYPASAAYGVGAVPTVYLVDEDDYVVEAMLGWDRDAFNELGAQAASLVDAPYEQLVPPDDAPDSHPAGTSRAGS